jgi:hypothetical protein
LLRNSIKTEPKIFVLFPSTKYIALAIEMASLYGKKLVVKRGKRKITERTKMRDI